MTRECPENITTNDLKCVNLNSLSLTHNIVLKAALILTQLNGATLFRCAFVFFVITASTGLMRQY